MERGDGALPRVTLACLFQRLAHIQKQEQNKRQPWEQESSIWCLSALITLRSSHFLWRSQGSFNLPQLYSATKSPSFVRPPKSGLLASKSHFYVAHHWNKRHKQCTHSSTSTQAAGFMQLNCEIRFCVIRWASRRAVFISMWQDSGHEMDMGNSGVDFILGLVSGFARDPMRRQLIIG